jgi:hypothetical protein
MSGMFIHDLSVGLAIIVNTWDSNVRRRFSYAHEYAHALFDRADSYRFTQHANADEMVEKRANAFAASFLMPRGGIEDQLRQLDKGRPSRQAQVLYDPAGHASNETEIRPRAGSQTITWQDIWSIARHFGVGYESTVWRLRNLGYLGPTETNALLVQKDKRLRFEDILKMPPDDAVPPPDNGEQELRNQIVRLAIEAYRREEISRGRLRELAVALDIRAVDMVELAESVRPD